jgi:AbiU2
METARDRLKDVISEGVVIDIFQAEEALALYQLIGQRAEGINAATFGTFFGSLQMVLLRHLILSASRIFEPETRHYRLRSIPAALKILQERAEELVIEQSIALTHVVPCHGIERAQAPRPEITRLVANYCADQTPKAGLVTPDGLSRTLDSLKTIRDKFIAHPEAIRVDDLPKATLYEIADLLSFAKRFVDTIGFAYLSTAYADDSGEYMLSSDAERATRCLKRLLKLAGC